jgi:transposase
MLHKRLEKTNPSRKKKVITEDDLDKYIITAKCIKVIPTDINSRKTINDAIAVSRKIWNCCATEIQKNPTATNTQLRDKFITEKNMTKKNLDALSWTFRIQQKVREAVTRRFSANYETAQDNFEKLQNQYKYIYKTKTRKGKKLKKKVKKKIVMQFREKTDEKQSIYLSKEICKFRVCEKTGKTILETFNGVELVLQEKYDNFNMESKCNRCQSVFNGVDGLKSHMKRKKPCGIVDPDTLPHSGIPQAEMILQRIGFEYYLYVPEYKNPTMKDEATNDIVALDAGWNTMLTYFSPSGEWGEICPGIKDKITSLRDKIDKIKSQPCENDSDRLAKKKAITKRNTYIRNMIDDLQWKTCHWLLSKYKKIIISRLYVARSNKQGKQTQADLKLCQFVDRLTHKSMEYKNSEIHVCREHNTSKACTKCLSLNTVKDKTVRCYDCKHEIHRDLNGARNIFLKHCF